MWRPRLRLGEVPQATLRDQQEHRKPQALSPSAAQSPMRCSEASNGETHRHLPQEPHRDIPYRVSTLGPLSATERNTLQPPQRPHGALRDLVVPHRDLAQRFPESSHREPHRGHTERLQSVPRRPPANVRDLPWFSHRDPTKASKTSHRVIKQGLHAETHAAHCNLRPPTPEMAHSTPHCPTETSLRVLLTQRPCLQISPSPQRPCTDSSHTGPRLLHTHCPETSHIEFPQTFHTQIL